MDGLPSGCPFHGRHLHVSVCGVCEYVAIEVLKAGYTADDWYADPTLGTRPVMGVQITTT